jgi:anti-sigma factor (TIGR02949 family)
MDQPLQPNSSLHHNTDGRTHKCEETLKKVLLMLDHELDQEQTGLLMLDLKTCEDCFKKYNIEKEFKDYMHGKFVKKQCTEHLRQRIFDIVNTQIN